MKDKNIISSKIVHFIFTGTALYFSLIFIGIVIAGEMIAMFIVGLLPPQPPFVTTLLDSFLLLIISFPILYFFVFRKLKNQITESKQAALALRNERLLLRTVIDNVPDSIYCKDSAGRKTLVNHTELLFSRTTSETEVIGKTDFDLYPKELAEAFFADDQLVLQTGQPVLNREEFVLDNNGMKKWLLTSKIPMKDEVGNITGIIGIGRDITSRRQTEEELRESEIKLKVILQSTADGILAINGNGKIIKTNKRFAELWRIPQELIDLGDDDAILSFVLDQLTNPDEFISKVQKLYGSTDEDLDHLHFRDGRVFERFSAPLNMPDSAIGRVWSFRDITERMRSEEELKLKNEELSSLNAEKDKFFSIIAHDLKGPFNGFLGLTQIMADELPSLTAAEVQNIAVSMRNSAKNLYHLLENLLDWSQIQKGAFPFNPEGFQLGLVVGSCVNMIHESAKSKDIEISINVADGLFAFADKNMIQTVIRNLVLNAIKFTRKGGKVSILAKATADNNIEISIQDNGIGMSQNMIENLFRIDVQNNRTGTEGESGTGLGLLLCKEFIEKHGGKIWVESEENSGSTFYFTFPYNPVSEEKKNVEIQDSAFQDKNLAGKLKIVIAEDDQSSEMLLRVHRKIKSDFMKVKLCNSIVDEPRGILC
jgi:PAS domain S-box-containing protein